MTLAHADHAGAPTLHRAGTRALVCGCVHAGASGRSALAGEQGHARPPAPATHGRHCCETAHERTPARDAGEAGVFRNHVAPTADRAWLARKHVPSIEAFVGIVLRA